MNVALAGLTAREELALVMLVSKTLPGCRCGAVPAGRQVALPQADLYVVDLAGRGLARWSEESQETLLQSLDGVPAVLVAPAFDQSWLALDASRMKSQSLVLLHKPYGIEDMRTALLKAAPRKPVRAAPPALHVVPPVPATVRVAAASAGRVIVVPVVVPESPSPAPAAATVEISPMTVAQFQSRLGALPASEPKLFLYKLAEALRLRHPFEVRVTFLNRLIFNPDEQWVASNTPAPVLQGLCQNDALASATAIDVIDRMDARARAQRLDMPIQPLESFLGTLMHDRIDRKP